MKTIFTKSQLQQEQQDSTPGKELEQTFLRGRHAEGQYAHEKMLDIINRVGNANQNCNEAPPHLTLVRTVTIKK